MTDILFFVEDDGAANLLRGLMPYWTEHNITAVVLATGSAATKLTGLSEQYVMVPPEAAVRSLLEQYEPRLVAVGTAENPDTLALPLVRAAQAAGIPTVGLVDAYANAAWRWRGRSDNPLEYLSDYLVVADEPTSGAYRALGVASEKIKIVGDVHVDYIAEVRQQLDQRGRALVRAEALPKEAEGRPVVVFVAEQFSGIDPAESFEARVVKGLEATVAAARSFTPAPYVVARLHPRNKPDDLKVYENQVDWISYGGDALPVVYSGDMIVGSTSTLMFEAALLGRPTAAWLRTEDEREWLPSIALGITPVVATTEELREKMALALQGSWPLPMWPGSFQPGARPRLVTYLTSLLKL